MRKEAKIKDSIKGFHWWLGALLLLLSACVTDYEPKGLEQVRDLLVVDGIITNGETTIKLRRSVGLTDDFTEDEFVNNAKVVVEREDGAVFTCANSSGKGEYKVDMGELDPGSRLHISLDGLEYESDYLGPEITPPIDSLSLLKKGPGEEVRLCVSTHNAPDRALFLYLSCFHPCVLYVFAFFPVRKHNIKAARNSTGGKAGNLCVLTVSQQSRI